jgi:glutamate synthase (NADPH/NADH) small chain
MGEVKGFLKFDRQEFSKQPPEDRIRHWNEFIHLLLEEDLKKQGARCMDCGVPFCHSGCPVSNLIPDWNELAFQGRWEDAFERLYKTNNFPEFTGRICPAPCENACVLGYNYPAVTIKNIELSIIEKAYECGYIVPRPPKNRTGKTVAVVGSGPAGLACADQLNKKGHKVTVFEKNERIGGLLRLGIPDFKLGKQVIDRRVDLMKKEGVEFKTGVCVGQDIALRDLTQKYHAVVLTGGAEMPRDLPVEGRNLKGVYFAMEFLTQQNRVNSGLKYTGERIDVKGKKVVVIGGGDTGSDCVGTSRRQGAESIVQIELLPRPPKERAADNPWPQWALIERTSSSHEEGVIRDYAVLTKKFSGQEGVLKKLHAVRLEFGEKDPVRGRQAMKEVPGSAFELECDFAFLAMGFVGPVKSGMIEEMGIALDARGNIKTDKNYMSSVEGVFAAGDMRRGQSLVVWAINEGREAAEKVYQYLKKKV